MSVEDAIEKAIGPFGKYQTWMLILITIGRFPTEFQLTNVVFIIPGVDYVCMDDGAFNMTNHCPCQNPEYDVSTIASSVTSEWNLICNRTPLASLAQSMMQVGILVGSLIFGYISDRYGRKLAVLLSLFLTAAFTVLSAVLPYFWMFLVSRFLIGTSVGGTMLCCYVLLIELSGKSFRPYLAGFIEISYVAGYFFMAVIAYFIRDWRTLQLVTGAPWLLVIVFYWLIPESPRWLITVGKTKAAIEVLTYIAKKNNRPTENIENLVYEIEKESTDTGKQQTSYIDLFRTPKVRVYTIVNALVWMLCSHTFFGVNQYIGRLQGNLYLNVMLSAVCLIPGLFLVVISTLYLKRRLTTIITFSVAGAFLLAFIFIPEHLQSLTLTFAIIGQVGIYSAFVLIYLFCTEIFPTIIRNSAMGFASVFARFGSFVAPFVVNIGIEWVSIIIFSFLSFTAAVLCCLLPETKDIVLLNTIEQTERSNNKTKDLSVKE